jgi:RNA polymerase sigma-70 factor, ECF subfamily
MNDAELSACVRGAVAGDAAGLATLVERLTPALLVQAEHRVGGALRRFVDPADVVNDVWLAALPKLADFRPPRSRATAALLGFLGVILLRRVRDLYEKHFADKPAQIEAAAGASSTADPMAALSADTTGVVTRATRGERRETLRAAIAELDDVDRAVVVLRAIEGRPMEEVTKATGLGANHVSVRLRRALEKLRRLLPRSVFEDLVD